MKEHMTMQEWVEWRQELDARPIGGWQPIETAPHDSLILGWNNLDGFMVCYPYKLFYSNKFVGWRAIYDDNERASDPTHWIPLPEPPK